MVSALVVSAVVIVGVVAHLIVGAMAGGAAVIAGVVARQIIGAGRGRPHAGVVIVRVVARRIVNPVCGRRPGAAMMVMGIVPRSIVVPMLHQVDLCRVIRLVEKPMAPGADRRESHSSLHRFQDETPR